MSRVQSKVVVNNFVGGLVSDFHELNSPPNTTVAESNVDLDRRGFRKRRLGIDFEDGYRQAGEVIQQDAWLTTYTGTSYWLSVAEDATKNFLVVQGGAVLSFFDMGFEPLSDGEQPFTVDLNLFLIEGQTDASSYPVQTAYGKGVLFVCGQVIEPFYVVYNPSTKTITTTKAPITIRDLDRQDMSLALDFLPTTLTPEQQYDLYNQGWSSSGSAQNAGVVPNMMNYFYQTNHTYPSLNKTWWLGKFTGTDGLQIFSVESWKTAYTGLMLAPLGHFIINPFYTDRSTISGIPGIPVESTGSRPSTVAFYSGRAWFGYVNKLYYSQIIQDDLTVTGQCYQSADPTAEFISDIIASDGGTLTLLDCGTIYRMVPYENSLFIFCSNGVWCIGGSQPGSAFSGTDFAIYKVSEAGALSARSVVSVEGKPFWWSKLGIYTLSSDMAKQGYTADNIILNHLQLYYNAIPALSKTYAQGTYDQTKKVICWIFNSTDNVIGGNPYVCDSQLNFDLIHKAWYPYQFPEPTNLIPGIVNVFNVLDIVVTTSFDEVVDSFGNVVTDNGGNDVVVEEVSLGNASNTTSSVKYLTYYQTVI